MKTRVYFYRGGVERACTENGKPSYRWHDGFSANSADGSTLYPWQTIRECQAEARRDGFKAEFQDLKHGQAFDLDSDDHAPEQTRAMFTGDGEGTL